MSLDNGLVVICAVLAIAMIIVLVRLAKAPSPLPGEARTAAPRAEHSPTVTVASLTVRRWWSFAQPRTIAAVAALAVATLVVQAAVVLVALLDQRAFGDDQSTTQFAAAVAAAVIVLTAVSFFLLRRFAHRAAPPERERLALDIAVRSIAARIVTSVTSSLLFALLANAVAMLGNRVSVYLAVRAGQNSTGSVAFTVDTIAAVVTAIVVIGVIVELIISIVLAISLIGHELRQRRASAGQTAA